MLFLSHKIKLMKYVCSVKMPLKRLIYSTSIREVVAIRKDSGTTDQHHAIGNMKNDMG